MPWLVLVFSYLLGSVPTAYIAGRLLKGKDIRQMGDRNVGARNAFNELGHKIGIGVFFIDAAKGLLAIFLARAVNLPQAAVLAAGALAVIGHNWPIYIGFRGGRGESTTIGVLLAVVTQPMLIVGGPALAALIIRKNITLTSVLLFVPLPLVCWLMEGPVTLITYSLGLPCLVGFTHFLRERRLAVQRESEISEIEDLSETSSESNREV